jgi:hypothetical protein
MTPQQITLNVAGAVVTLPEATLTKLWLDRVRGVEPIAASLELTTLCSGRPRIGEWWDEQGGFYVGLARGRDLGMDYHLLLADSEQEKLAWQPALDWAKALTVDGHKDFSLPNRSELALLFANVKELFKPEWYWSSEQYASDSDYAWFQTFGIGYQDYDLKTSELRARAVRRLAIE